jgi:hypothetical protein
MYAAFLISLILLSLSGVLLDMHRSSWRSAKQNNSLSDSDLRFARAQYRRRTQASGIIGAIGVAIALWPLVPPEPWPYLLYTGSLAGACACIMLLAAIDVWATRQNYARLRSEQLTAQVKLVQELRRNSRDVNDN